MYCLTDLKNIFIKFGVSHLTYKILLFIFYKLNVNVYHSKFEPSTLDCNKKRNQYPQYKEN
jgi:hypothetical protein